MGKRSSFRGGESQWPDWSQLVPLERSESPAGSPDKSDIRLTCLRPSRIGSSQTWASSDTS